MVSFIVTLSFMCVCVCVCVYVCVCTARLFHQAFISFRKYVLEMTALPADLHIILSDICFGAGLSVFNYPSKDGVVSKDKMIQSR